MKKKEKLSFKNKLIFVTALGVLVNGMETKAATIVGGDSFAPTIETNGNVTNIWAGKVDDKNAFNHFNDFNLNANEIANMYFNKKGETQSADRLFNFVNSQIKVNGVLNAIKENKIGGDLYFLSNSGMIVGSTGVINTGSLYILTPTKDAYENILGSVKNSSFKEDYEARLSIGEIPINPQGTITVEGKVRATKDIKMYAANINIGSQEVPNDAIILETGVGFEDLVNVGDESTFISNGLVSIQENLDVTQKENGDIVLSASSNGIWQLKELLDSKAESITELLSLIEKIAGESYANQIKEAIKTGTDIGNLIENLRPVIAEAKVNINGGIKATGNVEITANAKNIASGDEGGGNALSYVNAEININKGKITGNDIVISAEAENVYLGEVDEDSTVDENGIVQSINTAIDGVTNNKYFTIDAALAVQKSSAEVNIGEGVSIEAEGGLEIDAKNTIKTEIGSGIALEEASGNKKKKKKLAAAGGVVYSVGNAGININSANLTSKKGMKISSNSTSETNLNISSVSNGTFTVGLGVLVGDNTSNVNISNSNLKTENTTTKNAINELSGIEISSETENIINSSVVVAVEEAKKGGSGTSGQKNEAFGTAVNIVKYNSDSNINIDNSTLETQDDLNVLSNNIVKENTIIADNTVGTDTSKFAKYTAMAEDKFDSFVQSLEGLFEDTAARAGGTSVGGGASTGKSNLKAGAAIGVVIEENNSGISIKNSNLKAKGDLNINSETKVEDTHISIAGDTYAGNKKGETTATSISAALLYSDMTNNSSIEILDEDEEKSELSGKNINISSNINIEYNRINNMITELLESKDNLLEALKTLETYETYKGKVQEIISQFEELIGLFEELKNDLEGENGGVFGGENAFFSENTLNKFTEIYESTKTLVTNTNNLVSEISEGGIQEGIRDEVVEDLKLFKNVVENSLEFAKTGNYGNIYVRTSNNKNKDTVKGLDVAGSVVISSINNNSNINIGNVKLSSEKGEDSGNIAINSNVNIETASIYGNMTDMIVPIAGSNAQTTSIGGSFGMQEFNNSSNVKITEGTEISGEDININSNSDIFNVTAAISAGSSGKNEINGMVSYNKGDSESIVSVDDEVKIEANNILLSSINNLNITNIAGGLAKGGNISVGAAAAVNEYNITNKAEIKDNDYLLEKELYTSDENGEIITESIKVDAKTEGLINAVSVAGGLNTGGKTNTSINNGSLNNSLNGANSNIQNIGTQIGQNGNISNAVNGVQSTGGNGSAPTQISISGAGSVSVNINDSDTNAEINGVDIILNGDKKISVSAKDESFTGAWSGAAALNFSKNTNGSGAAIEGAVGINVLNNNTSALLKNVSIKGANSITVTAENNSTVVAAGLGLGASSNAGTYMGGASVSVNDINHTTTAEIGEDENGKTSIEGENGNITVNALESGTQITGGVNIEAGKGKGAVGAGVTVAQITNNVNAGIKGGTYTNVGNINVDGTINMTQVTAATAIGVVNTGATSGVFQGAVVYNGVNNNINSTISGADIVNSAGNINVTAGDISISETKTTNKYDTYLTERGIDVTGESYYENLDLEVSSSNDNTQKESDTSLENNKKGTTIITAGMSIAGSNGNAGGAAVVVGDINNNFNASIENSSINTSGKVDISSAADSFIVGAAGGLATSTSGSFGVMGSVSWQDTANRITSEINNSDITANNIEVNAQNSVFQVNTAGQISYGSKVGAGAVLANSTLDNETIAKITGKNNKINLTGNNSEINILANNSQESYTIGAGVSASKEVAMGGSVAITIGNNDTSSSMENIDTENSDITISANSDAKYNTGVGSVSGSGKGAVGVGVAINTVNQNTSAKLDGGDHLNVRNALINANSISNITTIGIGGSVAGTAAVSGSIATNKITNNTIAELKNASITADGSVGVVAESDDIISNYAGTISGAGKAAIGASVSVNEIAGNTTATVENSTVVAKGNGEGIKTHEDIDNDEIIDSVINDKTAELGNNLKDKRKETTTNGIVVSSSSTHTLKSLLANAGIAGTAAVNGTVNVNKISGSTGTNIIGSTLNSTKDLKINASDYTNSSGIVGSAAFAGTAGIGAASDTNLVDREVSVNLDKTDSSKNTLSGDNISIEAISKQGISSFGIGVGVAGKGAGVAGVVSVVDLKGTTSIGIDNTEINSTNDISINSDHYGSINLASGTLGGAGIGAGVGAGISVIKDNNEASIDIENSQIVAENNVNIDTKNHSKLQTAVTSVGLAGIGAGVAGTVSVNNIANEVSTNIENSEIRSNSRDISINSDNTIDTALTSIGVAGGFAGVGAVVNVNTMDSSVITNVSNTDIQTENGIVEINANEVRNIDQTFANASGGAAAVGGNVIINNFGTAVDGEIKISEELDINGAFDQANGTQENKFDNTTEFILGQYNINGTDYNVKAEGTEEKQENKIISNEGIKVNISNNSNITGKKIDLSSNVINNINTVGGGGSAGAVSASGSVAITNIDRNIGINISNSEINSTDEANIEINTSGNVNIEVYQGSAGVAGLGAAYAGITSTGESLINISNSNIISKNNINISAEDTTSLDGTAAGLSGGIIAAGVIISEVENNGIVGIEIEGSKLQAENELDISSKKENEINSEAIGGAVGVVTGIGVSAIAKDNGTSKIEIANLDEKLSSLIGKNVNIEANNNMAVNAKAGSVALGSLGAMGVSVSIAETSGNATIIADDETTISGDNITIESEIGTIEGKESTVSAETDSVSAGVIDGLNTNIAEVQNSSSSQVDLKNINFIGKTDSRIDNLSIFSKNNTKLKADIGSLSFGGRFAAGANTAIVTNTGNSSVNVSNTGMTEVENFRIEGTTNSENTLITDGNGGGGIAIGAAIANNKIDTDTTINIKGDWNISELLEATATDNNKVSIEADSVRGGFVGANGITITNEIKSNEATKITIEDGTNIAGSGTVNVESENNIDVDINANGAAYGGIGFAGVNVTNTVDKKAEIELGKVNIKTDGKQEYQAFTNADILVKNKIDAAGLAAITVGSINNSLNTKNNISLAQEGHLETTKYDKDITLAASDKIKDVVEGIAESSGAGAGARAEVTSNLDRKNRIDINGSILSYNDVKLYSGMDKNGKESNLDFRALSHTYAHGVFAGVTPILNTNISVGNQVVTGENSKIESVRNINIEANSGESRIERAVQKYTWYDQENSSDFVTSGSGESNENINSEENYADIKGEMTAGIYANQEIVIDGVVDLNSGGDKETDIVDANVTSDPNITYGEGTKIEVETGIENYANSLIKRYNEICELLKSYTDEKSAAYQGYQAEKVRILNTMLSLGLAEEVTYKDGTKALVPVGKLDVQYVKISDIVASGGNITINSGNIKNVEEGIDSNRIVANGNPQVSITNNSNLYLKVGDIRVLEKGGKISFNNKVLKEEHSDNKSAINITNNWDSTLKVLDKDGNKQDVKVLSTIEIMGNIENLIGDINITNKGGDILMQGEKIGDSTNIIAGGNLNLSAKGSISQAYTEGITNIGTAPEESWKEDMEAAKDEVLNGNNLQEDQKETVNKDTGIKGSSSSGMIAGGEIYLNGEVINVNGKIQSGFDKYEVTINENTIGVNNQTVSDLIASYDKEWANNKTNITDSILKNYILTEGGNKYDEKTGTFYYEPATYYDPSTKQVIVENIDVGGGKVYITGRVISTGNGKITALDGAANINIDNNTSNDLKVGTIENNDVQGLISINDTQKNIITEYYRDKTIIKEITDKKDANGNYIYNVKEIQADGSERYYTPDEGMRYNWTEGTETGTSSTYTQSKDFYLWGGIRLSMDQIIKDYTGKPVETEKLDKDNKPIGSFVTQDKGNSHDFSMDFTNKVGDKEEIVGQHSWTDYHDFLHFSGTDYYEWTVKNTTEQSYTGSIKADRNIGISFIGSENGNINIESNKNIELAGSIINARGENGTAITNITSNQGSIKGTVGTITADIINLSGKQGIENIVISGIEDTVSLKANAINGNVGITAKSNIALDEIVGKDKVELFAYGNIYQQNKEKVGITGSRIDLVSEIGGIDLIVNSGDNPLIGGDTLSASINASATGDINLKESEGDMRIGKIYSSQGDVTLETEGYIVDALPTGDELEDSSTEDMINRWEEAGLIESDEFRQEKENQYNEYANGVKNEYQEYLKLKGQGNFEEGSIEAERFIKLDEKYSSYKDVDDYLNNSTEGQNQIKLRDSGGKWDKDQLLYAIKDNIVNQEGGSTQKEVKDPNIKGENITIKAGKGVGVDKGETIIDLNNLDTEALKKLSSSEASDVTWDKEKGIAIIREKNPIGIQMTNENGKLNVEAKDNIYLAARTELKDGSSITNSIYVDNIKTDGNIRLLGTHGVYNASIDETPNFEGNDLILEGGIGDLGEEDKSLTMKLKGDLTVRTDKNMYLYQDGDMNIIAMYAGERVNLEATGNIFSVNEEGFGEATDGSGKEDENLVLGYINAQGDINLIAGGDIGTDIQGLNIKNGTDAVVDATGNNIYLNGKKEGALNLGTVVAKENVGITSESGIKTIEELVSENGKIDLESKKDIELGGAITGSNISIVSEEGRITEVEGTILTSENANIRANSGINLNQNNYFSNLNLSNNIGNIIVNNKDKELNLNIEKANSGNIEINNTNGDINIKSDIITTDNADIAIVSTNDINIENHNLNSSNNLKLATINNGNINLNDSTISSTGNLTMSTVTGDISGSGTWTSDGITEITTVEGDITNTNEITSEGDLTVTTETGNISGNMVSGNNVAIGTTNGDISISELTSEGNTDISTKEEGNIDLTNLVSKGLTKLLAKVGSIDVNRLNSTGKVHIETETGNVTSESLTSGATTNIDVEAGNINLGTLLSSEDTNISTEVGDILAGNVTSEGTTNITTGTGTITVDSINSTGNLTLTTNSEETSDIIVNESLETSGTLTVNTNNGNINLNDSTISSTGNLAMSTVTGDISGNGTWTSGGITEITTVEGDITNTNEIASEEDLTVITENGNISGNNILSQNGNIIISTIEKGKILVSNLLNSIKGKISLTTNKGDIETNKVSSNNDILLTTNIGNITNNDINSGKDIKIISNIEGDITINDSITSNGNIDISTNKGDIFVKNLTSKDGKVKIKVNKEGNITSNGELESLNSTLEMYTALGDIDFNEIFAEKDLSIGTENGSLIGKIVNGENIIIVVKNREDNMRIDKIIAGNGLTISSNKISIDDFIQRDDADGMLEFKPQGSNGNEMIDSIEINNIKTENGLLIPSLWAKYANIGVDSKKFYITNLKIDNKGYFHDDDTYVTVWGSSPILDNNNMQFWQDKNEYIYLYFLDKENTVVSNGKLLKADDYFYPYFQRFSAVQIASQNLAKNSYNEYEAISKFNFSSDNILKPIIINEIDYNQSDIINTELNLLFDKEELEIILNADEEKIKSDDKKVVIK